MNEYNMYSFLTNALFKNKIGIHNIVNTKIVFKNKFEIKKNGFNKIIIKFRSEPYAKCAYLIRNNGEYIPYDKMTIDINEVFIEYGIKEYNYFKKDIVLLHKLSIDMECDDDKLKKILEKYLNNDCRLIC
jgi:hypothetical protein